MSIPKNITKEHVEKAIEVVAKSSIPTKRLSNDYFLEIGNRTFPPKYIISIANIYANNKELDSDDFNAVEAVAYLRKLNYKIVKKDMGYYLQLKKFLSQAQSDNLTTWDFEKEYFGLRVKVSFGQGNQARIPWIAFLKENQTVQKGIYPVYLFYKERNLLILAYGVSETNPPDVNWNLPDSAKIKSYFKDNGWMLPDRYGDSYVYKVYKTNRALNKEEINRDINKLIAEYDSILSNKPKTNLILKKNSFQHGLFAVAAQKSGLSINSNLALRFISSLLTKPFVILTGLSGSGKTKLAQAFASWISENENQYCIVPVGSDWTNREPLLGFPNALKSDEYVKPDNKVLDLIIAANNNQENPYFLILDEMNLSHVERYFADFLSVMESSGKIALHPDLSNRNDVPPEITLPKNLFIIGTVNIDETTYMFSPKVLDRANVIEFRVTEEEMKAYFDELADLDMDALKFNGSGMAAAFVEIAKDRTLQPAGIDELKSALLIFFNELKNAGAEFGYRSAAEIVRFAAIINKIEPSWTTTTIIDAAVMQKLLPKIHGSRRKLENVLKTLGKLCLADGQNIDEFITPRTKIDYSDTARVKYPVSLEKILRMYRNMTDNGFTSYAEA